MRYVPKASLFKSNRNNLVSSGGVYQIKLNKLPATKTYEISKAMSFYIKYFGVVLLIFAAFLVYSMRQGIEGFLGFLPYLLLLGAGISLIFIGYYISFVKEMIKIDEKNVSVQSRSIFGEKSWQEAIPNYMGILNREETRSDGGDGGNFKVYIIELHHNNRNKSILLYMYRKNDRIRDIWRDYAKKLNLPLLEESRGRIRKAEGFI